MGISAIVLENFKSYGSRQEIPLRNLNLFLGANSSGKSSAIQALMILKQTLECSSPETELLLSGKYANLGDFADVLNNDGTDEIVIGIGLGQSEEQTRNDAILWHFKKKDNADNDAMLYMVEMSTPFCCLELKRMDDGHYFRFYLDGSATQYFAKIENLNIGRVFLGYNNGLNDLFFRFLKALSSVMFSKKDSKAPEIERTQFMPIEGLQEFEQSLIPFFFNNPSAEEKENEVLELIDCYCKAVSEDSFNGLFPNPQLRKILWSCAIKEKRISEKAEEVCKQYRKLLSEYLAQNITSSLDEKYLIRLSNNVQRMGTEKLSKIQVAINSYNDCIQVLRNRITYLGPIRERPQGLYNVGFEAFPKYVGPTGAFFASVLYHEDKEREYLLPNQCNSIMSLSEACAEWLEHIGVASSAKAEKQGSFGIRVAINNMNYQEADIMNVGIGTSQVLPVLLSGLLSSPGDLLLFEQPELHLHPLSQSRLVDFFVELAKNNRNVIVETHSEQILLRLRYLVLDEKIEKEKIKVVFFQNEEGTKVKEVYIDNEGGIEYPPDFMDVNEKLIDDLLNKSIAKRRTDSE